MRPTSLNSVTNKYQTARGSLYIVIVLDENNHPCEVYGFFGKNGIFERGVMELVCRLVALNLQNNVPIRDIIEQCQNIREMEPSYNLGLGSDSFSVHGIGDCIAHSLKPYIESDQT